jgi:Holliday junction resolvase RusA-like endonuclease
VITEVFIKVIGEPGSQGSKKPVGNNIWVEDSKKLAPWRQDVRNAAREQYQGPPLDGALELVITFWLKRPDVACKGWRKNQRWVPYTPDPSKILRSTEDALVQAGTVRDDSRFVRHILEKCYVPLEGGPTGADITISVLDNGEVRR